ncbi:hypothetical protein EVAR_10691_1 [Eumeta japonica]|uniref:Uncharacterized protein n=1 Tax=Eumeta variegata TaxID=151549 RepID=A0A4C1U786_EUMVA|nr:hypothetical protein EVAR_10691_1 [Eumeta japonica]
MDPTRAGVPVTSCAEGISKRSPSWQVTRRQHPRVLSGRIRFLESISYDTIGSNNEKRISIPSDPFRPVTLAIFPCAELAELIRFGAFSVRNKSFLLTPASHYSSFRERLITRVEFRPIESKRSGSQNMSSIGSRTVKTTMLFSNIDSGSYRNGRRSLASSSSGLLQSFPAAGAGVSLWLGLGLLFVGGHCPYGS